MTYSNKKKTITIRFVREERNKKSLPNTQIKEIFYNINFYSFIPHHRPSDRERERQLKGGSSINSDICLNEKDTIDLEYH